MSATLQGPPAREFPAVPRARGAGAVVMARCGFPGEEPYVREARAFVRSTLALCPALKDDLVDAAMLLVSEVAANAVRHTRSGEPGGRFGVEVVHRPGAVTVSVHDEGPRPDTPGDRPAVRGFSPDSESGRGLAMVEAISSEWHTSPMPGGRVVAFSLDPGARADGAAAHR
ncbi:ATP-binding protein [Nocardiopsis sp. RSe5-2]|uniref:ATP-binding protein n=1 Tax=Nocardiopsis endophytica TaxID=3018445 RepID=A0ABT4U6D9_9ACTN|nr:ATP-binding protein [Nocardiopsis endophytica]MDA2812044.1 ATP-binding protein [Nocardiopsis endophytica]